MSNYIKTDELQLRLVNYLNIPDGNLLAGAAAKKVDVKLIARLIEQNETLIDLGLGQVYKLPIPNQAKKARIMVGTIVEKLVCAEIMATHFTQRRTEELGSDIGYGQNLRKEALDLLKALLYGHGVFIPGLMAAPTKNATLSIYTQPLILPEVQLLKPEEQPDLYSRSFSFIAQRAPTTQSNPFDYDYQNTDTFY